MREIAAVAGGGVAAALGAFVIYDMAGGANPQFDRGVSPLGSVITQEAVGAMTLLALAMSVRAFVNFARGKPARATPFLLVLSLGLFGLWRLAVFVERAS